MGTFLTIMSLLFTSSESLSVQTIFAVLLLGRKLTTLVSWSLPQTGFVFINIYSSLQRIQNLLERSHWNSNSKLSVHATEAQKDETNAEPIFPRTPSLNFCDVTSKLPPMITSSELNYKNVPLLNYVTLNVSEPGLVLITGSVGSGKSSLLTCVLDGELHVTNGIVKHTGSLAYISDSPWTFPGTIRENILFGLPYKEELYLQTVEACQLKEDFKTFPQGDLSRIGGHGATVSGGQRTRIALARAVYSNADIFLLDDPLSSLDAKVAENILKKCLRGLLADRIVLLTTRAGRYLREANYIVKLKRGVVVAQGNFELMEKELSDVILDGDQLQDAVISDHHDVEYSEIDKDYSLGRKDQNETTGGMLQEEKEDREVGNISIKIYWKYFVNGASTFMLLLMALVFVSGQGKIIFTNYFASKPGIITETQQKEYKFDSTHCTLL